MPIPSLSDRIPTEHGWSDAPNHRLPSAEAPFFVNYGRGVVAVLTSLDAALSYLTRRALVVDTAELHPAMAWSDDALRAWGRWCSCGPGPFRRRRCPVCTGPLLVDAQGAAVDLSWFVGCLARYGDGAHERRALDPGFRRDPVRWTGRRHGGSWLRHPKTIGALRHVAGRVREDDEPAWRGRTRNLPTAWDDAFIRKPRCWKRYRRYQWKVRR